MPMGDHALHKLSNGVFLKMPLKRNETAQRAGVDKQSLDLWNFFLILRNISQSDKFFRVCSKVAYLHIKAGPSQHLILGSEYSWSDGSSLQGQKLKKNASDSKQKGGKQYKNEQSIYFEAGLPKLGCRRGRGSLWLHQHFWIKLSLGKWCHLQVHGIYCHFIFIYVHINEVFLIQEMMYLKL